MRVMIEGYDLPGRTFCGPSDEPDGDFRVGVPIRMLNRIDPDLVRSAENDALQLLARVRLSDDDGTPRCARVDPPDISWNVATN